MDSVRGKEEQGEPVVDTISVCVCVCLGVGNACMFVFFTCAVTCLASVCWGWGQIL